MKSTVLFLLSASLCSAEIETLFQIGEEDGNHLPFAQESGATEAAPGSATAVDDHCYTSAGEADSNYERALTSWDPRSVIHFELSPEQANPDGVLGLSLNVIWSGMSGGGTPSNQLTCRLNGVDIFVTPFFESYQKFEVEVASAVALLQAGANTLEIARTDGTINTWLGMDSIGLVVNPTANQDSDGDGLPLSWETLYQLSDNDSSDAAAHSDDDQLTNLEEFLAGTNPRNGDSDADGLADHLELTTDPLNPDSDDDGLLDGAETTSDPALADTDGDGAFDAWEIRTGFDPANSGSTPPPFSGAFGINFRSAVDETRGSWNVRTPNGWVPQTCWNHTELLRHYGVPNGTPLLSSNTNQIAEPSAGTLLDAAGNALATTINFTYDGTWTSANSGAPAADLLHGFLRTDETFNPTITLAQVPYANYDLYLYLSAEFLGTSATVRLNGDPATDITLSPRGTSPTREFRSFYQTAGPNPASYNTVRLAGLSESTVSVELIQGENVPGIAAIQVVDTGVDSDGDSLPDYWELRHRTDAGTSNATADPDGDLLNNAAEFARGTDPNNPDSDNDGLSDFVETNSGTFIDANNTGTNPLFGDSDGDSVGDLAELESVFPTNPLLADSDNDGQSDRLELDSNSDPNSAAHNLIPVPTFPSAGTLLWKLTDVQIVQDHLTPGITSQGSERIQLSLNVVNAQQPGYRSFDFSLVEEAGKLGYFFATRSPGGFTHPGGYDLFQGDVTIDYRPAMGFSGFGPCDISDPLTFEISAVANPSPAVDWTVNYRIINQKTATTIATQSFANAVAPTSLQDQSATWQDAQGVAGRGTQSLGSGVRIFRTPTPLETLPAFAAHRDSDNDGIPDVWEISHGLNPNEATDAQGDQDGDLLINRDEYFNRTLPNDADSDDDGVNDGAEVIGLTNPLNANSLPPFFTNPNTYNPDRDGNGLPDIWEAAYQATGLLANQDPDGDSFTNAEEAIAGTDPLSADSLPFLNITETTLNTLRLSWPNIPGKNQALQESSDLLNWNALTLTSSFTEELAWLEVLLDDPQQLFRVGYSNRNSDNDPLDDWSELALGFSPTSSNSVARDPSFDSDGDGNGDTSTSGDLAILNQTFANAIELQNGGPVANPTVFDASRLLMQASFGPTLSDIHAVQALGLEGWIDDQIENQAPTFHRAYIDEIARDFDGPRVDAVYSFNNESDFINGSNYDTAFARAAISGPDQLRQRVAFALSQIIVVSRGDANLNHGLIAISDFYDLLLENAFGNFEDLLMEVTLHPTMGRYLSHIGNQPPAPELNRFPDENYARELMQLFTIGIWELELDGTRKKDAEGNFIPTYSNEEITNFARVMTGLWFGGNPWGAGGFQDKDYAVPMEMHPDFHDFNPKTLLNGVTIPRRPPTRDNALLDIQDAVRNVFEHPNCAPFISQALIQFLVTSNPSPDYVKRISTIFADDSSGERGNLGAVVKAILMDPEARSPSTANTAEFGIFREPVIRTMHLARLTKMNQNQNLLWWDYGNYNETSLQQAMLSPSVFNFYRPTYRAPGVLTDNDLVSPALQITNSYSAVSFPNQLWDHANLGFTLLNNYSFPADYSDFLPYANDHAALLDYVNLVVCSGHMNAQTRSIILSALNDTDPDDDPGRVRLALYLALMSPQGAIQR